MLEERTREDAVEEVIGVVKMADSLLLRLAAALFTPSCFLLANAVAATKEVSSRRDERICLLEIAVAVEEDEA